MKERLRDLVDSAVVEAHDSGLDLSEFDDGEKAVVTLAALAGAAFAANFSSKNREYANRFQKIAGSVAGISGVAAGAVTVVITWAS